MRMDELCALVPCWLSKCRHLNLLWHLPRRNAPASSAGRMALPGQDIAGAWIRPRDSRCCTFMAMKASSR